MKGDTCPECGFEGQPWYEADPDFEYVNSCVDCQWQRVCCTECGHEFSYVL